MTSFFRELKQRRVVRVAIGYAIAAWLIVQIASTVLPTFHVPEWVLQALIVIVALGFPTALVLAWAFDVTPSGVEKTLEGTGILAAKNRRHGWLLAGIGILVAVATISAYWLWHSSHSTKRNVATAQPIEKGRSSSSAVAANKKSIAVLPFESLSEDKANAYFATGIQDEILTRLAKVAELKVISRTSTQHLGSQPGNLSEIAKQLGVAHILEGSVQKAGDSVRVNVQLIKAEGDSHLWAETYDRKLTDIFAVETEVAQRIASSLEAKLTGREQAAISHVGTKNSAAYDTYLRAVALRNGQSRADADKVVEYSRQAVELDPGYADGWALLSMGISNRSGSFQDVPDERELCRIAAEKAIALGPDLSNSHSALGCYYYYFLKEYGRALSEFEEARKRSPNDPFALHVTALVGRRQGKYEESVQLQLQAAALDPLNQDIWVNLGRTYHAMRRLSEAREMYDHALSISPGDPQIIGEKAGTYLSEGNLDAADRVLAGVPGTPETAAYDRRLQLLIYRRQFDQAIGILEQELQKGDITGARALASTRGWIARLRAQAIGRDVARPLLLQAREELRVLQQDSTAVRRIDPSLLQVDAWLGDRREVEASAEALLEEAQKDPDVWAARAMDGAVARAFGILGDADRAIPLLTRALSQQYTRPLTPAILRLDPIWDPIRNDPRFQKLCKEKKP